MLIEQNSKNGRLSIHSCDMCRRKVYNKDMHKIMDRYMDSYIVKEIKRFDLCNNCYNKVCNSIKIYYDRRKKEWNNY